MRYPLVTEMSLGYTAASICKRPKAKPFKILVARVVR